MKSIRCVVAIACVMAPVDAMAQTSVAAGASVLNEYVFRGVTTTNSAVIQPDLSISHPFGRGSVTFGAFGSIEPSRRLGLNDLSQAGGARSGLAEVDVWAEYGRDVAATRVTGGVLVYAFDRGNATATSALNTTEVYAKLAVPASFLAPEVRAYWDVRTIHGWYVEGQLARAVPVRGQDVTFTALAGMSAGQERRGAADAYFVFAKPGLTHVDVSATSTFTFAAFTASPTLHVQFSPAGQNTRIVGAMPSRQDQSSRIWFGVRIGAAGTVGARPKPPVGGENAGATTGK